MTLYINVRETITVRDRVGDVSVQRYFDIPFLTIVNDVITSFLFPNEYFGVSPPSLLNGMSLKPVPAGLF